MRRRLGHLAWVVAGMLALSAPWSASASSLVLTTPGPPFPEGQQFAGVIITTGCSGASDASAISIDWGDGSALDTSSGNVTDDPLYANECDFSGSHKYVEGGQYAVKITYTSATYGPQSLSDTEWVIDQFRKPFSAPVIVATAGVPFSGAVTTFGDAAGLSPSGYGASIAWGDGTSDGTVSGTVISGSHTYSYPGSYYVRVSLTDDDPPPAGIAGASASGGGNVGGYVTVGGNCPSAAPGAAAPFTATAGSANANFVQALYHDLLGQPPDATRAPALVYALDLGVSRDEVVRALLATDDYRTRVIESQYQALFHRPVDAPGLADSLPFLAAGGSDEQLLGKLLISQEYTQAHQSDLPNVEYCDVLQRPFERLDANGGSIDPRLGPELLALPEYAQFRVTSWFDQFLRRPPDPAELDSQVGALAAGSTDEQVIASLLSSPSYYRMFTPKKAFARPSISPRGVIQLTLTRPATIAMNVLRVLTGGANAAHGAASTATPPLVMPTVRRVGELSFGRRPRGRVTITWGRSVNGHPLARGLYLLQLKLRRGATTTDLGDAIPFRVN